jgi:hypothetical protein
MGGKEVKNIRLCPGRALMRVEDFATLSKQIRIFGHL